MTVIYISTDPESDSNLRAFATKKEAFAFARYYRDTAHTIRIEKIEVASMPIRKLLCAVFNHEGYVDKNELIEEIEGTNQ